MNFLLIFVERAFAEVCWNHYTTKLRILKQDFCLRKGEIPALHAHIAYKYESKVN